MEILTIIIIAIIVAIAVTSLFRWNNKRGHEAELAKYAQITEPIIVSSYYPGDTTVKERATFDREMLKESGNRWGKGQSAIPVHEYVFCAAEKGGMHTSWNHYLICLGLFAEKHGMKHNGMVMRENEDAFYYGVNGQQSMN